MCTPNGRRIGSRSALPGSRPRSAAAARGTGRRAPPASRASGRRGGLHLAEGLPVWRFRELVFISYWTEGSQGLGALVKDFPAMGCGAWGLGAGATLYPTLTSQDLLVCGASIFHLDLQRDRVRRRTCKQNDFGLFQQL